MASGSDPYEQQLLAVFESCCEADNNLDGKGLARLCEKLQLEEQAPQLVERLLGRDQASRQVTFNQFRDALLAILAGGGHRSVDTSPEREVRPKFVVGEKKYGRRSRPENSESDQEVSGSDSDCLSPAARHTPMSFEKKSPPHCEEASPWKSPPHSEEASPWKRKPSQENSHRNSKVEVVDHGGALSWQRGLSEEEECVRATWEQLGAGHEGYLGRHELHLVCKAAGLEGVADQLVEQLFQRLGIEQDGRISFDQFLHLFRSGLTTNSSATAQQDVTEEQRSLTFDAEDDPSKEPLFISLDTYSSGLVSSEQLLSLWETGGVVGAARLLHDLGLGTPARRPISLAELAAALEEEARALVEEARNESPSPRAVASQPLTSVLHASLIIHQTENKCLKAALEQMLAERDKLRQDVSEANERASSLAQEVDDRHARLELTTKQQARLQEQRHAEEVRSLQDQLSMDRDQLATLTTGLELRLGQMQSEETRLRCHLASLDKKCDVLDKDNSSLKEKLSSSEEVKSQLQWKVESLPQLELRLSEVESENAELQARTVLPLQEKLESLSVENTALRDANDELTLKLEELSTRQTIKKCSEDGESPRGGICRRRGRCASSDDSSDDDSPPLGKLRRRSLADHSTEVCREETERLERRVADLERQLALCQEHLQVFQYMRAQILQEVMADPEVRCEQVETLKTRCDDLTQLQKTMEAEFEMQLYDTKHDRDQELQNLQQSLHQHQNKHSQDGGAPTENLSQVKVEIERLLSAKQAWENCALRETKSDEQPPSLPPLPQEGDVTKLRERVSELEGSLELMREEYERCEDYWQGKLEEERRLFEQEQAATDDRFSELENKIHEYEELLCQEQSSASNNTTGRLSPIQESFALEKQVTDLEDECSALRDQLDTLRSEHSWSQQKLSFLEAQHQLCRPSVRAQIDAAVQTELKQRSVSLLAAFSGPAMQLGKDKQTQVTSSRHEENVVEQPQRNGDVKQQSLHRSPDLLCDFPPKSSLSRGGRISEQSCRVQLNVMQTLSSRLQHQEQRGRRLEALLSQHHIYTDRLVQQHHNELNTLQAALHAAQSRLQHNFHAFEEQAQKLASNDVLVKDLYVENALLLARVDNLEHKLGQHLHIPPASA